LLFPAFTAPRRHYVRRRFGRAATPGVPWNPIHRRPSAPACPSDSAG